MSRAASAAAVLTCALFCGWPEDRAYAWEVEELVVVLDPAIPEADGARARALLMAHMLADTTRSPTTVVVAPSEVRRYGWDDLSGEPEEIVDPQVLLMAHAARFRHGSVDESWEKVEELLTAARGRPADLGAVPELVFRGSLRGRSMGAATLVFIVERLPVAGPAPTRWLARFRHTHVVTMARDSAGPDWPPQDASTLERALGVVCGIIGRAAATRCVPGATEEAARLDPRDLVLTASREPLDSGQLQPVARGKSRDLNFGFWTADPDCLACGPPVGGGADAATVVLLKRTRMSIRIFAPAELADGSGDVTLNLPEDPLMLASLRSGRYALAVTVDGEPVTVSEPIGFSTTVRIEGALPGPHLLRATLVTGAAPQWSGAASHPFSVPERLVLPTTRAGAPASCVETRAPVGEPPRTVGPLRISLGEGPDGDRVVCATTPFWEMREARAVRSSWPGPGDGHRVELSTTVEPDYLFPLSLLLMWLAAAGIRTLVTRRARRVGVPTRAALLGTGTYREGAERFRLLPLSALAEAMGLEATHDPEGVRLRADQAFLVLDASGDLERASDTVLRSGAVVTVGPQSAALVDEALAARLEAGGVSPPLPPQQIRAAALASAPDHERRRRRDRAMGTILPGISAAFWVAVVVAAAIAGSPWLPVLETAPGFLTTCAALVLSGSVIESWVALRRARALPRWAR